MSIVVSCQCGRKFSAQPYLAGKSVACPGCGGTIQVPGLSSEPAVVLAQAVPASSSHSPPFGNFETSHAKKAMPVWPFVLLGVFGVMLLGCGGAVFLLFRSVTTLTQNLNNNPAFKAAVNTGPIASLEGDYAELRKTFRTTLIQRGPAPQEWDPLTTPPGADRVDYQSGPLTLAAFVDKPNGTERRPAVLFLHGGFAFGDGDWEMAQPFRDAGYIVMMPVLRGENGQPGDFSLFYDEVDDVLAAADKLASLPYVDRQRIFVAGHSAGGTLAALAALASPRFKAAASFSGCLDQQNNGDVAPFDTNSLQEFQMRSPAAFPHCFKCPTRLYYGNQESWIFEETNATVTAAQAAGLDVVASSVIGDHMTAVPPATEKCLTFFESIRGEGESASPPAVVPEPNIPPPTNNIPPPTNIPVPDPSDTTPPAPTNPLSLPGIPPIELPPDVTLPPFTPPFTPPAAAGKDDWQTYNFAFGRCELLMPGRPQLKAQTLKLSDQINIAPTFTVAIAREKYECSATATMILLMDPDATAESMLDTLVKHYQTTVIDPAGGKLEKEEAAKYQEFPGKKQRFTEGDGWREVRTYAVGAMHYQLVWLSKDGSHAADAEKFFGSFKTLGEVRQPMRLPRSALPAAPKP